METIEQKILSLEKHIAQQPKSPLFAQLASYYLDTGRPKEALSLCDKGLAFYPFYTTGHLIKGKTLLALNMRAEARREFEIVHNTMPANEAVSRLLAEIPSSPDETLAPISAAAPFESGVRTIVPKAKAAPVIEVPVREPEPPSSLEEQVLSQFTEPQAEPATSLPPDEPSSFEPPAPEAPVLTEASSPSTDDPFGISAPAEEAETFGTAPQAEADAFTAADSAPSPQPVDEGEPFETFAERMRMELIGTESTLSLDEYLHGNRVEPASSEPAAPAAEPQSVDASEDDPFAALRQLTVEEPRAQEPPPAEQPSTEQNQIEEITEKLKEAKRITPVINFSERSTAPLSESESPAGSGFVTPTLAEIYAKQGWFDDAIKAYRTLAANKPAEREKFEKRIQELEEMKNQQPGS